MSYYKYFIDRIYFVNSDCCFSLLSFKVDIHLLALLGAHHFLHVSEIRVKQSRLSFVFKGLNTSGRGKHLGVFSSKRNVVTVAHAMKVNGKLEVYLHSLTSALERERDE
jgi:hypothetical protein